MIDRPSDELTLTLPDGSTRTVAYGTLPRDVVASIGAGLLRAAVAVEVNGAVQDLVTPLRESGAFRVLTEKDERSLECPSPLRRAPARHRGAPPAPEGGDRIRSRHRGRLLLRLRGRRAVHARRSREDRSGDAPRREREVSVRARGGRSHRRAGESSSTIRSSSSASRSSAKTKSSRRTRMGRSSISVAARTCPTRRASSTSSCCTPRAHTGAAMSTGRCCSASTAPRGGTRKISPPICIASRRPSAAIIARSGASSISSPPISALARGSSSGIPTAASFVARSRTSSAS